MVLWRGEGELKTREMMDLLFSLAIVGLLTKRRGGCEAEKQAQNWHIHIFVLFVLQFAFGKTPFDF